MHDDICILGIEDEGAIAVASALATCGSASLKVRRALAFFRACGCEGVGMIV